MKFTKLVTSITLTVGSVLFAANSAQAASFTSDITQDNGVKGDVFLNSIEQNGKTIFERDFSYVDRVVIGDNDEHTKGNTGAASTDHGDDVKGVQRRENLREGNASDAENIVEFMGNNNLNKIIDTEDKGNFSIDFLFGNEIESNNLGLDSLFFWERGFNQKKQKGNSDLLIQAIDAAGNTIGDDLFLSRKTQQYAGFNINTKEIGGTQAVGSWGVSFADLGLSEDRTFAGVRVMSEKAFNGPDYKIIASNGPSKRPFAKASVPEPGTIIGLGSVAALAFFRRRKSK
ncbi:MAG: exosortase-dependent surface protein XDP2 [Cyanobacteriota bacterium]|nr:exosortase-dependent surface protein XDP2 [Cyanobacteriota bacterium]